MKAKDLRGQPFGRWTVLERFANSTTKQPRWLCQCSCGKQRPVLGYMLTGHRTSSCGCLHSEITRKRQTTHGMSKSPTYRSWHAMWLRCTDSTSPSYPNYGAKGITVCDQWRSFETFYQEMGPRQPDTTIDRIDASKGYSKANCRWASWEVQQNHRSSCRFVTFGGKTQTVSQWSRELGIRKDTLSYRLKSGRPLDWCLSAPTRGYTKA